MRKALIVGIDEYPTAKLNSCVKDAISMASVLEKNADGSPNFHVKLLTEKPNVIDRKTLRQNIESLFEGNPDIALFYFSGHGFVKSTGGYIVTSDFEKYDEGISMTDLLTIANKSKSIYKIIILDCCYSGKFGDSPIGDLSASYLGDGLTVLTACSDKETALEINGSSVFTSLLLDGLHGGAADLRGNITPGHLYAYVDEALGAWDQRPIFKTNVSQFTSLRQITPRVSKEILRRITSYFINPQDEFKLDPTFEDTDPTSIAENVIVFKDLQKLQSVGLVVPVGEEFMYYAAMNSKACKLTAIGYQYWRLVNENKLT
ncbi:MAG: caspase family protein [Sphingobacterium sp.]|jgi:uncharacterized caspase-like protein|uniref:caspase family protein n=1 Tax=Sphingobacterium sp. TaxID=341027 RepID=UPI00284A6EA2|nr:caspase family protein [Sphingobacterium sp.]MDR3007197.1 caspase family protein [Sphingobacterium sp.]